MPVNRAHKTTHEWAAAQQTMHAGITSQRKASLDWYGHGYMDLKYAHTFSQFSAYQ